MRIKKQQIFTKVIVVISIVGFLILTYFGLRYVNTEDISDKSWSTFSLIQASFILVGFLGTSILVGGTFFPTRLKSVDLETITRVMGIMMFITGIQILTSIKLSISNTEQALYFIFVAIGEELFFRSFLIELMRKFEVKNRILHNFLMVIVSTGLFMAIHTNYYNDSSKMLTVGLSGVVLAIVYIIYRDITANILAHVLNNSIAVGLSFLTVSLSGMVEISLYVMIVIGVIMLIFAVFMGYKFHNRIKYSDMIDMVKDELDTEKSGKIKYDNHVVNYINCIVLVIILVIVMYFIWVFEISYLPFGGKN